jgi:uncharacterized protein (DUF362 family)
MRVEVLDHGGRVVHPETPRNGIRAGLTAPVAPSTLCAVIRRFVFLFALWPLVVGAQLAEETPVARAIAARSQVYYAADPRALTNGFTPTPAVVQKMVDDVVMAVTKRSSVAAAWLALVKPTDVVGIKVAAAPGAMSGTHPAVVRAVARGLQAAGVRPDRIIVWDRNIEDLRAAGFSERDPDFRVEGIDPSTGYDRQAMLTAPVLGRLIWGDSKFGEKKGTRMEDILSRGDQLSSTSFFATVLSQRVTKVINLPSLCDSFMCGLNGALANMTLWNVDNWRRFIREPDHGNPYVGEIYKDAMVRDKVVLTIMDGLALQFAGGPFPNPNFTRQNFTIYASIDPVAIDATALRLIDEYRGPNKLPPAAPVAAHVETASAMGLGNFLEPEIDLIRVGADTPGMR